MKGKEESGTVASSRQQPSPTAAVTICAQALSLRQWTPTGRSISTPSTRMQRSFTSRSWCEAGTSIRHASSMTCRTSSALTLRPTSIHPRARRARLPGAAAILHPWWINRVRLSLRYQRRLSTQIIAPGIKSCSDRNFESVPCGFIEHWLGCVDSSSRTHRGQPLVRRAALDKDESATGLWRKTVSTMW